MQYPASIVHHESSTDIHQDQPDHIIILEEISKQEVQRLFAHTAQLKQRDKNLLLVDDHRHRKGQGKMQLVRSRSNNRGREVARIEVRR